MNTANSALTVLTAMITPTVLILACASLLLSTSQRLSRCIERVRKIAATLADVRCDKTKMESDEQTMLKHQLELASERSVLLQRAMTQLYLAICAFVGTSVFIAALELTPFHDSVFLLVTAMLGAVLLFVASITLIFETRLARRAVREEMIFAQKVSTCKT